MIFSVWRGEKQLKKNGDNKNPDETNNQLAILLRQGRLRNAFGWTNGV